MNHLINEYASKYKSKKKREFKIGDTISVHLKIAEGEKERIQVFTGIVIAKKGSGISQTFSLYRSAYGCNMERVFYTHSPKISKIQIERSAVVRKSKLYYLRTATGQSAKLREKFGINVAEESSTIEPPKAEPPTAEPPQV